MSRVEAGRGLATPALTFLKLQLVMVRALRRLQSDLLSEDVLHMIETLEKTSPPVSGIGFEMDPVLRDPALDRLIHVYRGLSERDRHGFLSVLDAAASSLGGPRAATMPPAHDADDPRPEHSEPAETSTHRH